MMVRSRVRGVALCPNWPPIEDFGQTITSHRRIKDSTRHRFPASLEAALDSVARELPDDLWILRQRVRIAIDHRDPARIRQVVAGCTSREWCDVFAGYASYLEGDWQAALTTWQGVLIAMYDEERCRMLSAVELVYGSTSDDLEAPCLERAALDRDLWWLGKPLFGDSLNYRGIEHIARVIRTDLASDFPRDVHFDLRETHGGDAVQQMRVRYGWPAHTYWGGDTQDLGHRRYLSVTIGPPHHNPPYVSPEYSSDGASTMPTLKAALAPYSITDDAFALDRDRDSKGNEVWPQEFFTHPFGQLLGIRTQQRGLLRRDSAAMLVVATKLPTPPIESGPHARVPLRLYSSTAPDSLQLLAESQSSWGTRAFISGMVHKPTVIGLEVYRGGERITGARSRFGIAKVTTHANAVEACRLSEPILLDADSLTGNGMRDLERGMLSDTRLNKPVRLGVMWESYGARVSDSATLRVRVIGLANRSGLGRIAQALRVVGRQDVAIEVAWREPTAQQQVEVIEAAVPTLSRQLTLDVSSLRTGSYGVQLSMTTRKCESVSEVREFSITR
jgi:hypothetical protein